MATSHRSLIRRVGRRVAQLTKGGGGLRPPSTEEM